MMILGIFTLPVGTSAFCPEDGGRRKVEAIALAEPVDDSEEGNMDVLRRQGREGPTSAAADGAEVGSGRDGRKKPDLAAAAEDVGVGSGSGEDAAAVRAGRSSGHGEDAAALHAGRRRSERGEAKSARGGGGAKSSRVEKEERSLRVESCGGEFVRADGR
uniref:DUF834 domain-containing protein n=1 Tax=Oryza glumipatula TaxID=40148 RepID=A0A0D9YZQ8_9ORYZ